MTEKFDERYVSPQELLDQGFCCKNGRTYKQNTLERYYSAGWLEYGCADFTAIDRLSAGSRLFEDYYKGGKENVAAVDLARIRVDGCGKFETSSKVAYHNDCYNKAMRAVPGEFWPTVRRVCVEDMELEAKGPILMRKKELHLRRWDLCRGLDRLIIFYRESKISYLKDGDLL